MADAAGDLDSAVPLIESGTGVPSHAVDATSGLYIRNDPAGATTVLYVTHDNGTTWTALT